jgi:hypothetical protein
MADASGSMGGGVQHAPIDTRQALPGLTPQEEQAARLALAKLGSGAGALTSAAAGFATPYGASGSDSVMVGSGSTTLFAGAQHPTLLSGADSVVAGSALAPQAPVPVPGGQGSGFHLGTGTIPQHGPTAAGIKTAAAHTPAAGITMPDQTKINVAGASPVDVVKHHPGSK